MSDARNNGDTTAIRDGSGRFGPGNPGRPHGARHKVTKAVEALLNGEAEKLTRRAIEMALEGDTVALRLCMERIAPAVKGRTVELDLPELKSNADILTARAAIITAATDGTIDLEVAEALTRIVDGHGEARKLLELEERLVAIEAKTGR
jgi:hypothetical protein